MDRDPTATASQENATQAARSFQEGQEAMALADWDAAVRCLSRAVRLAPDQLKYREEKHRSCRRRFSSIGKHSLLRRVRLTLLHSRIKVAVAARQWIKVDQLAEAIMEIDPWDARIHGSLAEAAAETGRQPVARYMYASALKIEPQNIEFLRCLGEAWQQAGRLNLARDCYRKILEHDPINRTAEKLIRAVEVAMALDSSSQPAARHPELAAARGKPHPGLASLVEQAEELQSNGELRKSLEVWRRAAGLAPDDLKLRMSVEDTEIAMLREDSEKAGKAASADPKSTALRESADRLNARRVERELEILTDRADRLPNDLRHTQKLADHYRRAGRFEQAIQTYARLFSNKDWTALGRVGAGECALRLGQAERAEEELTTALLEVDPVSMAGVFKRAHYWMGRLREAQRRYEQAVKHYELIRRSDRKYLDVARRIKHLFEITWP